MAKSDRGAGEILADPLDVARRKLLERLSCVEDTDPENPVPDATLIQMPDRVG